MKFIPKKFINSMIFESDTFLTYAVRKNKIESVKILLEEMDVSYINYYYQYYRIK